MSGPRGNNTQYGNSSNKQTRVTSVETATKLTYVVLEIFGVMSIVIYVLVISKLHALYGSPYDSQHFHLALRTTDTKFRRSNSETTGPHNNQN